MISDLRLVLGFTELLNVDYGFVLGFTELLHVFTCFTSFLMGLRDSPSFVKLYYVPLL